MARKNYTLRQTHPGRHPRRLTMPRRPDNLETLHLSLELLKRIPHQRKIDSRELQIQLKDAGYERDDSSRPFGYPGQGDAAGPGTARRAHVHAVPV